MEDMMTAGLVRLTGLWKNRSRAGATYLAGKISSSSRLLVLPNEKKEKDSDPDYLAFIAKPRPAPEKQAETQDSDL